MVAKAAWLVVEPEINLASYLASEEPCFLSSQAAKSQAAKSHVAKSQAAKLQGKDYPLSIDGLEHRPVVEEPSDD